MSRALSWVSIAVAAAAAIIGAVTLFTPVFVSSSTSCGAPIGYFSNGMVQMLCGGTLMPMLLLSAGLFIVALAAAVFGIAGLARSRTAS